MIKIALIEDNSSYRNCLQKALAEFADITVTHALPNALQIISDFAGNPPDVVLVDYNLPGINGANAITQIRKVYTNLPCLLLTAYADADIAMQANQSGAAGCLLKNRDSIEQMVNTVRRVIQTAAWSGFWMGDQLTSEVMARLHYYETRNQQCWAQFHLTDRQLQITKYLWKGFSYTEIADRCGISKETLNSHIKAIYPKLGINSRKELVGIVCADL